MKIGSFVVILLITLAIIVPSTGVHSQVVETEAVIVQKEEQKTGTSPVEGRTIAVDPEVIPLGIRVHLSCKTWPEINGVYIAEDTGRLINGNIIDIYMADYGKAVEWGRREVTASWEVE